MAQAEGQGAVSSVLVTGGARSGKSRYAEQLILESGLEPVYVATSAAWDGEMKARIGLHRARRGADWHTIEDKGGIGADLTDVLRREAVPGRALLVDCLTLWLTNLMMAGADLAAATQALCALVPNLPAPVVFVSNEVGLGIVPDNAMARQFRDAQGRLNQELAAVCSRVVFVAAGLPLVLKPSSQPDISL